MSAHSPFWTAEQSRSNLGTSALQAHAQAQVGSPPADLVSADESSIDELDAAICRLARHLNAQTYRMLLLVREFDDRMGWAKWNFRSCAEWLAWRCGLSLSAAREKVRTAQALREMPRICAAFADGRLSYSKVRALTRVVQAHDEDLLLAYALQANAAQVEGRCRQIRNATPESVGGAWRAPGRSDLPIDTVKRLTCDGSLVTIVEDDHGTPLDVGRKRRTVSTPLKRALWSRDRGRSFPGVTIRVTSTRITFTIGRTAATRASRTSRCSARTITRCCTRAGSRSGAITTVRSTSGARMGG
jgi:hypothetical protein